MPTTNAVKLFSFLAVILCGSTAQAATIELRLAQACFVEGGWSVPDCATIVHIIKRRAAGSSLEAVLWSYSALKANTPRAVLARDLPDGDFDSWSASENRAWSTIRAAATEALAGRLRSACPGASHWGAPDIERDVANALRAISAGRWRVAKCRQNTRNVFYAITSSNADSASVAAQLRLLEARLGKGRLAAAVASGSYRDRPHSGP